MFNIGFSELIIIAVIALIFIGPKQLPEIAKALGKLIAEFKRATEDITGTVTGFKSSARNYFEETQQHIHSNVPDPHTPPAPAPEEDPHQLALNLDDPSSSSTHHAQPIKKDESGQS